MQSTRRLVFLRLISKCAELYFLSAGLPRRTLPSALVLWRLAASHVQMVYFEQTRDSEGALVRGDLSDRSRRVRIFNLGSACSRRSQSFALGSLLVARFSLRLNHGPSFISSTHPAPDPSSYQSASIQAQCPDLSNTTSLSSLHRWPLDDIEFAKRDPHELDRSQQLQSVAVWIERTRTFKRGHELDTESSDELDRCVVL
ncbi:hypothetical protein PCASD_04365 [Puccinia coronata f. sp. avenae]|uniref:Uncharacterized protein n=1 Tax=Puccinia coronata f. sp. avenae TaxID=200324 RepID=A0A2N5SBS4_9BASI|nr:hypothetical protein PCASD_22685 [Puccinia coronata f. sp. avenae]PLW47805.1 hypothetical protein PCASD_04365 [Puccinia coronata f. sp. avenae]